MTLPRQHDRSAHQEEVELRLYVTDQTPNCVMAIDNLRRICEEHMHGHYRIEVIDLLEQPQLARGDEIIAVPTLIRELPDSMQRIIGDLSDTDKVLVGLQLRPEGRGRRKEITQFRQRPL